MNQKNPSKTVWKESSICTKTWNNSVLQFMKVSDMMEADAGFLLRDTVVFVCEILDCCPWFEFADLEVSMLFFFFLIYKFIILQKCDTCWLHMFMVKYLKESCEDLSTFFCCLNDLCCILKAHICP